MKDRIAKIIKEEGLTSQQFAEKIEMQSSTISHILSGRNMPSFKIIHTLLDKFPNISPDWLILGSGDMNRIEISSEISDSYSDYNSEYSNQNVIETIDLSSKLDLFASDTMPGINVKTAQNSTPVNNSQIYSKNNNTNVNMKSREPVYSSVMQSSPDVFNAPNEVNTAINNDLESSNEGTHKPVTIVKMIVMYSDNTFEEFLQK